MKAQDVDINAFKVTTHMGKSNEWTMIPGIDEYVAEMLNNIGYGTVKSQGSVEDYLNYLETGYAYKVVQTKYDNGDYTEEFVVVAVCEKVLENNKPKKL